MSFLVEFLGSFKYKIISFANRDNLTSSLFESFLFFQLSYCLAGDSKTILNKSGESEAGCQWLMLVSLAT
jgi:hypothetical protein